MKQQIEKKRVILQLKKTVGYTAINSERFPIKKKDIKSYGYNSKETVKVKMI